MTAPQAGESALTERMPDAGQPGQPAPSAYSAAPMQIGQRPAPLTQPDPSMLPVPSLHAERATLQLPPQQPDASPPAAPWQRLWHEPWIGAHPDWLARVAPLPDPAATPLTSRLRYRALCRALDVDAHAPLPHAPLPPPVTDLPLDGPALRQAALALGRVAYVSHALTTSRQQLAHLFADAPAEPARWQEALRHARARVLQLPGHPSPRSTQEDDLIRWASPWMGHLLDELLPGAWSRLRLRLDPALVCGAATLTPSLTPAPTLPTTPFPNDLPPVLKRYAWRLWRAAC